MRLRTRSLTAAVAAAALTLVSGCGGASGSSDNGDGPIRVGLIYSKSGALENYGAQYRAGFAAGLEYATDGTGKVNGREIKIVERDGAGKPSQAVSAATELIGKGLTILAGATSSGVAVKLADVAAQNQVLFISGPAATDAVTGINEYTFRSGRQTYQDVKTAARIVGDVSGKDVLVFAQDYEFGKANAAAVKEVLGAAGASVSAELVPTSAKDFTPYAQKIKQADPDLLFVAWAGKTTASMWKTLAQQDVFATTEVVTGLGAEASYPVYGPATEKITFLSHYFPGAPDNKVNEAMIDKITAAGKQPDLFSPDGFVAAQMIVHAVRKAGGDGDVQKMISALEGWQFQAPKGQQTVRASDHAMIQPMFVARLADKGDNISPKLVRTVPAGRVAPPVQEG